MGTYHLSCEISDTYDTQTQENDSIIIAKSVWKATLEFLQRVRIARNADRCTSQRILSVCPSVRHIPVFRPDLDGRRLGGGLHSPSALVSIIELLFVNYFRFNSCVNI